MAIETREIDSQSSIVKKQAWGNENIVEKLNGNWDKSVNEADDALENPRIHTFDAMLRAAGDLAHHDLALEGPEDDHTEFDWLVSRGDFLTIKLRLPTIDIDKTRSMANQTI